MRICVIGDTQDLVSVYVAWLARRRGVEVLELPEDTLGVEWTFTFDDLQGRDGHIETAGRRYRFWELRGAYVRLKPQPTLPPGLDLPPDEVGLFTIERRSALQHLLNSLPFVVANRPCAGRSNGSKPFQMQFLAKAGFTVPRWVTTNEEAVVKAFAQQSGHGVIYKACSGLRSQVRLLDEQLMERLRAGTSPVVVQEYIPGRDVRVHVVRDQIFATAVISNGVDYRFASGQNEFQPTTVPDSIGQLCGETATHDGLIIAGFDFRVTEDGDWYCLEMNPVPTFLPYEMATGQPIGQALLDAFTNI